VVLAQAQPGSVTGLDASLDFVAYARETVIDRRVTFQVGEAQALPFPSGTFDFAVSGLVLNFVPEPQRMVSEMVRVVRHGGTVALYVWDYSAGMEFMRIFWDVATELNPAAADLDEGRRFPITNPDALSNLFRSSGAHGFNVRAIDVPTLFESFNDFWEPFLASQGPAPGYVRGLPGAQRDQLRTALHDRLPIADDGSIALTARAWAVRAAA
jgi:SAM-dependent methyltransferase